MTEAEERAYLDGQRHVYRTQILEAARRLDPDDPLRAAALAIAEVDEAQVVLRETCASIGAVDYPDGLHLVDVLTKHLRPRLAALLCEACRRGDHSRHDVDEDRSCRGWVEMNCACIASANEVGP